MPSQSHVAIGPEKRPARRGSLSRKLIASRPCCDEAVSWLQSFVLAALVLCGLYGLFVSLLTSKTTLNP
jgi:hypothetical protein